MAISWDIILLDGKNNSFVLVAVYMQDELVNERIAFKLVEPGLDFIVKYSPQSKVVLIIADQIENVSLCSSSKHN